MNKLNVFIKDTFTKIVKSVSFLSMLLTPLIVIAVIIGIGNYAERTFSGPSDVDLAVISEDQSIGAVLEQTEESIQVADDIQTEGDAREAMTAEKIDGYLVAEWEGNQLTATITHNRNVESNLQLIEQALMGTQIMRRAQELDVSPEELQSLNEPVQLTSNIVSVDDGQIVEGDSLSNANAIGSAYFINIMVVIFIMFYATTVIEEVAGEKGTRMMEVILSSTTATTHFFGKLIGVFLVMLVHVLFYVVVAIGAFMYFKDHEFITSFLGDIDLLAVLTDISKFSWIFLLIGVLMYMFFAAFLGSLITKTEDINRAATPLSLLVLPGFYIGLFAMAQPENILVVVSSFIPFLSPFVMPFRIATNTVSELHVWLSIGGSILFTVFVAIVSLVFYRANVLIYSDTSMMKTIKQSWALVRSEQGTN